MKRNLLHLLLTLSLLRLLLLFSLFCVFIRFLQRNNIHTNHTDVSEISVLLNERQEQKVLEDPPPPPRPILTFDRPFSLQTGKCSFLQGSRAWAGYQYSSFFNLLHPSAHTQPPLQWAGHARKNLGKSFPLSDPFQLKSDCHASVTPISPL